MNDHGIDTNAIEIGDWVEFKEDRERGGTVTKVTSHKRTAWNAAYKSFQVEVVDFGPKIYFVDDDRIYYHEGPIYNR